MDSTKASAAILFRRIASSVDISNFLSCFPFSLEEASSPNYVYESHGTIDGQKAAVKIKLRPEGKEQYIIVEFFNWIFFHSFNEGEGKEAGEMLIRSIEERKNI